MITTDLSPRRSPTAPIAERETQGLRAGEPFAVETGELLDHRTRARAIPIVNAPSGRYLAFEEADAGWLLPLSRPVTHIGRGLNADLRLEDPHVSRRHAIVALRGEGVRVLDDRSADGTFVNGRPIDAAQLHDGDVVRVGRAVFRYLEVERARLGGSAGHGERSLRRGWVGTGSPLVRRHGAVLRQA